MLDIRRMMKAKYMNSHALVIGVNKYESKLMNDLLFAVSDASEVADTLKTEFGFPEENVRLLLDEEATRDRVIEEWYRFTGDHVDVDDRIVVFYAGHGLTRTGLRGERGFLVPHDGEPESIPTMIPWKELLEASEHIRAKHILFIMDACYGGLALTRSLGPGKTRFLNDTLCRLSRQVLTAGKADELVSDTGGPLEDHSVFTGHLLEGMRGKAALHNGIITANSLMSYVFDRVAADRDSNQTPHFGYADGDGDMVLSMGEGDELDPEAASYKDILFEVTARDQLRASDPVDRVAEVKTLISNDMKAIELHDLIMDEVRTFLSKFDSPEFSLRSEFSPDLMHERIERYDEISKTLALMLSVVAYWARPQHHHLLQKAFSRSTDGLGLMAGKVVWGNLRWYPLVKIMYTAGVSAVAGGRYDTLNSIFSSPLRDYTNEMGESVDSYIEVIIEGLGKVDEGNVFKSIPGHEKHHYPLNEYLYRKVQPDVEDIFFTGAAYESSFDDFEILLALASADVQHIRHGTFWMPPGRYGWKHGGRTSPFSRLVDQATELKGKWPPIMGGLFGGSYARFKAIQDEAKGLVTAASSRLN